MTIRLEAFQDPSGRYLPQTKVDVVVGKGRRLAVSALIDSGADRCVVPKGITDALGVNWDRLPEALGPNGDPVTGLGAGGKFEMRECRGKIRWRIWTVSNSFWVGPDTAVPWVLLGRDDFFAMFEIRFNWTVRPPVIEFDKA